MIKDYLNRKELEDGKLIIKMVKMGSDIDETRNHRIRGIVPTDDGKYVFIEILKGNRFKRSYTNLSKKEYERKYPYEEYISVDSCFRVDVPEDHTRNYSKEFKKYDKSYLELEHTKENIVKLLQKLNKNIVDVELVNDHYIDKYCEENGFYRLYDDRLEHNREPIKIVNMYDNFAQVKEKYSCYNYDRSVYYEEEMDNCFRDYKLEDLYKYYGKEKFDKLIEQYEKELENLRNLFRSKKESDIQL